MYYEDRLFLFFIFYYFEILLRRSMISLFLLYRAGCAKFLQVTICITRIVFHLLILYYFEILLWGCIVSLFSYRADFASSPLRRSMGGLLQLTLNSGAERRITPFVPLQVRSLDFLFKIIFIYIFLRVICNDIYYKDRSPFLFFLLKYYYREVWDLSFSYIELDVQNFFK